MSFLYDKITIKFISRKGDKYRDFSDKIEDNDELFSNGANNKRQPISSMNDRIISSIMNIEKEAINNIKKNQ